MGLKRELGLFEITLYGIGMIVGAGIYALIGKVAGLAGNGVWLSFLISSFLAIFTGLSYAELSSIFTKDSAEFDYVRHATKSKYLSYIVAWFMLASMIISATVVALGFGGYLSAILGIANAVVFAALSIFIFTLINFVGIKISAKINNVATILEVLGLALIIFGVIAIVGLNPNYTKVKIDYFDFSLSGVISGAILAFFAYIGFGSIAKMGEEVKNPEKTLPKAILLSIFITTLLYIGVAIASITIASPQELYTSSEPAALIAEKIHPNLKLILSIIALFSTGNTILLILISSSRMLYGLASQKVFPPIFSKINKFTHTPHYAVLITGIIATALLIYSDIKIVAEVTNLWIFICYFFVNLSVILLRYKNLEKERSFKIPLNIGKFPLLAFFGVVTSLWMIFETIKERFFLEDPAIYLTLLVLCIATIFYLFERFKNL
ncbi:MAG TPA: amino acid permease [Nanoarchaeota archaeon]|nr:amino acid permease [Nanoarchaeota archaeon]